MRIDIFHDTVCPWCRIGKKHLELALQKFDDEAVEIHYHPFFLDPTVPEEGRDFREHLEGKYGVPIEQMFERPRQTGENVGITFNFEKIKKAVHTLRSHRLIEMTADDNKESMIEAIYKAYFEDGLDINDLDVLDDIAVSEGWNVDDARQRLNSDEKHEDVLAQINEAYHLGVQGVPFFVFNNQLAFSGAQPPHMILNVLKQAMTM